jgi:tRNA(Glu) U13 pseudouridine synthase TruD
LPAGSYATIVLREIMKTSNADASYDSEDRAE